jgi:hypothetical protein
MEKRSVDFLLKPYLPLRVSIVSCPQPRDYAANARIISGALPGGRKIIRMYVINTVDPARYTIAFYRQSEVYGWANVQQEENLRLHQNLLPPIPYKLRCLS